MEVSEIYPYSVTSLTVNRWHGGSWSKYSKWCDDTIGVGNWEFYSLHISGGHFLFKREKDKLMFIIKWGVI